MDQEILIVFFYDVQYAVVMRFSAWSAVYWDGGVLIVFFYDVQYAVVMRFSAWSAVYWDGGEWRTADMLQTVWNEL